MDVLHFEQLSSFKNRWQTSNWQDMYRFDLCTKQPESSVIGADLQFEMPGEDGQDMPMYARPNVKRPDIVLHWDTPHIEVAQQLHGNAKWVPNSLRWEYLITSGDCPCGRCRGRCSNLIRVFAGAGHAVVELLCVIATECPRQLVIWTWNSFTSNVEKNQHAKQSY